MNTRVTSIDWPKRNETADLDPDLKRAEAVGRFDRQWNQPINPFMLPENRAAWDRGYGRK